MDRKEIKALAREKLSGNLWKLWWPLLIIIVVGMILEGILSATESVICQILNIVVSLAVAVFAVGYNAYLLGFVRGEEVSFNTIINCVKEKWTKILITDILLGIFIMLWGFLFVIPGIIKALAYAMTMLIVIDTDLSGTAAITESKIMMEGHKWEYFVFLLSFIGWQLLSCITCGIAYIYVGPYMMVSEIIYYEQLRGANIQTTATVAEENESENEEVITEE